MNTLDSVSRNIEDDWYGRVYLQVVTFEASENTKKSLTGVDDYEVSTMVHFNDYIEKICVYITKPSLRGRVVYFSDDPCRLCDGTEDLTTNAVAWTKSDGNWMLDRLSVCGRCINRIQSFVDEYVFENDDVSEDLVAGLI